MFTLFTPNKPTADVTLAIAITDSRGSLSDPREFAVVKTATGNVVIAGPGALGLKGDVTLEAMPPNSKTYQRVTGTVLRNEIANYGPPWAALGWSVCAASTLTAYCASFAHSPKLLVAALIASAATALITGGITLGDRTSPDHKQFRTDARAQLEANGIDVSAAHPPSPEEVKARYATVAYL